MPRPFMPTPTSSCGASLDVSLLVFGDLVQEAELFALLSREVE